MNSSIPDNDNTPLLDPDETMANALTPMLPMFLETLSQGNIQTRMEAVTKAARERGVDLRDINALYRPCLNNPESSVEEIVAAITHAAALLGSQECAVDYYHHRLIQRQAAMLLIIIAEEYDEHRPANHQMNLYTMRGTVAKALVEQGGIGMMQAKDMVAAYEEQIRTAARGLKGIDQGPAR